MRKIILYTAASLNGLIAGRDGDVTWLDLIPNPNNDDYGYNKFLKSIDTTIQGYNTYHQIIGWDIEFPYKGKKNYVLTNREDIADTESVVFIKENHLDFIRNLKGTVGPDIWLIGGGTTNTFLFNNNLIDEVRLFIMPIVLNEGIGLFENMPETTKLMRTGLTEYESGVVEIIYSVDQK